MHVHATWPPYAPRLPMPLVDLPAHAPNSTACPCHTLPLLPAVYPPLRWGSEPPYTPQEIMQDELMNLHRKQVSDLVNRLKGTHAKTVRMTEGSAHPFGGKAGITDSLTGALWVADYSMEMARAGMTSVSLHWGKGGGPGWCDAQGKLTGRGGPLYVGEWWTVGTFHNSVLTKQYVGCHYYDVCLVLVLMMLAKFHAGAVRMC